MSDDGSKSSGGKQERIVKARLSLRERVLRLLGAEGGAARDAATARAPQGSGPPNRHGMPRIPVGQHEVKSWPVLDLGTHPRVDVIDWRLRIDGAVHEPVELDWSAFLALPQVDDVSDFHCVTTWSKLDMRWRGVRFSTLMELAVPLEQASHVMCHAYDGYTTNLPLEDALAPDVLLVHTWEDRPLPVEHGGPVRMITPRLYAWKGAKWIRRIELMVGDRPGFWEERGYSMTARPWENDRYR